jgi:hypothetical protein
MRELLHEQRVSQAQQVEQMEQCHAEEAKRDKGTLRLTLRAIILGF